MALAYDPILPHHLLMTQEEPRGPVHAALIGTLSPDGGGKSFSQADRQRMKVPHDWQLLGAQHEWADLHGVAKGLPPGYIHDLLGRAAAAGEQLAIAFAALRDAEVWRDTDEEPDGDTRRSMSGRAMAEMCGIWAVSAGHAAINVVARVVRIHGDAKKLETKLGWATFPKPFDSGRSANLSVNPETVKHLIGAARQTGEIALVELIEPFGVLVKDGNWLALVARRDAGYHRLRPQSISGGVPSESSWQVDHVTGDLTISVAEYNAHVPPKLEKVVAEVEAGYEALSRAMREVHGRLPRALVATGVPLWKTS